jgi:diguanylate cyclase (GGDEF)-like protein
MSDAFASTGDGGVFSLPQIRHLLRVEFARAQRYGYPVALVLIDFAPVRRRVGDAVFDAEAAGIITRLRELVRTSDYVGRTESDRLLVLLPHTASDGAVRLARRASDSLLSGTRAPADGDEAPLGPAIGLASFEEGSILFFDALLEAAEESLEQVEGSGTGSVRVL